MALSQTALVILASILASTYKTLPFAYAIRTYSAIWKATVLTRKNYRRTRQNTFGITGENSLDVFRPITYHTYCSPLEIGLLLHKSNSTYFVDLDLARTTFLLQVFQKLLMDHHDNLSGEYKGQSRSNFPYIPVAEVQCTFRKEIKVFQRYSIVSSVLAWDNKWVYVMSKVVLGNGKLCTLAITRIVFKKHGRITMRPKEILTYCGLYNEAAEEVNVENYKLVEHMMKNADGLEKLAAKMEPVSRDLHL